MGMERIVTFKETAPDWQLIERHAVAAGLTLTVRMIDGLPAFPKEIPEPGWKEVRVSTSAGMMTLRHQPGRLAIVVWGNADENLHKEWELFCHVCARAVDGSIKAEQK